MLSSDSLPVYANAIGFWAGILTTVAFAPQLVQAWRTGGEGLSWLMLALFGAGVGLWFLYGLMKNSGPLMLANGLTGIQVLAILAIKLRRLRRTRSALFLRSASFPECSKARRSL